MKRLPVICLFLFISLSSFAEPIHGVGFAAGQLSGVGLSYRIMTDRYGAQITFGAISIKDDDSDYGYDATTRTIPGEAIWPGTATYTERARLRETNGNIGLMFMKTLHQSKWATLYALTGFCMFFESAQYKDRTYAYQTIDENNYQYVQVGHPKKRTENDSTIYGGLGIGIEIKFTANIRLALEWPLSFSTDGDFIMYIPQAGLHYFF